MNSRQTGQWAEGLALDYLTDKGLHLVERNFQCRVGELDLVMLDQQILVFVEVRYRRNDRYGSGLETITFRKQRTLLQAARFYLLRTPQYAHAASRFDVVSVGGPNYAPSFQWTRGAFAE
ncbi:MAG: YraN family protein [Proteobacteria bacterium]|nr:YraN family protein [Pseudomonadota bacterium]